MSGAAVFKKPPLPPPNPFKITASTSIEDWKKWQYSFRYYAYSINLEQESHDVQLCAFKSLLGPEALEIYNKFSLLDITDVESVMRKFDEHFKPKFNITLERYNLYNMHQQPGQRFDDYLTDITNQVDKCEFNSLRDDIILYKIVGGIENDEIRNALLADANLKYEKAVQICQASSSMHFMSDKENGFKGSVKRKRELGKTPKVSFKELRRSQLEDAKKDQGEVDTKKAPEKKKNHKKLQKEDENVTVEKISTKMSPRKDTTNEDSQENGTIEVSDSEENEKKEESDEGDQDSNGDDSDWRCDDDSNDDYDYDPDHRSLQKASLKKSGSTVKGNKKRRMKQRTQKKKVSKENPQPGERPSKLRKLPCDICGKTLGSELALERHRSIHVHGQHAICFYCGKQFSKFFLRRHMTRLHYEIIGCPPPKLYTCDTCDFSTTFSDNLRRHIYQHTGERPLACEFCDYRCIRPRLLKAHTAKMHTGVRPYSCSICKGGFLHSDALQRHMITHRPPEEQAKHREHIKATCEVCGKLYSSKAALKTHFRRHTGEKPYACHKCGYRTVTNGALTSHLVTVHSEEKPFVCTVCGYTCKIKSTLQQHSKTHLAEKPHACEVCGRKFSQATHVKRHMLTHTGDKPFICSICGHRWTTRSNLKQHMKVHEKHSGDGSQYTPPRKRQKKPPVVVVAVQSDESGHSEHAAPDAIITWSEQVSAINTIDYTPNLETPPPFHPTYPVHQGNPRPPDCRYYQQRQWQNQNYRQDQNQGQ